MNDDDTVLLEAVARGDPDALTQLYARHGLALLNYLIGRLGDRAQAEEVLQSVMLAVWKGAKAFRGDSRVRTWLFAIAGRQASKARRRPTVLTAALDDNLPDPDAQTDGFDPPESAFERLSPDQREALELIYAHGFTLAEAARQLRLPLNTLKSRLHRARQTLKRQLEMK